MLLKEIRNNRTFKIIFIIILLIIIFDDLILALLNKYFFKENEENENENENENEEEKKEKNIKENFADFEPSGNVAHNLGQIFKHSDLNFNAYPNVEIKPGQQLFQHNKFLPECCFYNSQYSTDKGCPCITPEQQQHLQRRGKNKHPSSFVQEKSDYMNLFFSPTMALQGKDKPFKQNNVYFLRDDPVGLTDASFIEADTLIHTTRTKNIILK